MINKQALKEQILRSRMTNLELAEKSGVSVAQIRRLVNGENKRDLRKDTRDKLAHALKCKPEDLDKEPTSGRNTVVEAYVEQSYPQFNFRMPAQTRNALSLVALRYGQTATDILNAAPLLFHLLAQQSLQARKQNTHQTQKDLVLLEANAGSWMRSLVSTANARISDAIHYEEDSIENEELFGESTADRMYEMYSGPDFDNFELSNPLASYITSCIKDLGLSDDQSEDSNSKDTIQLEGWAPRSTPQYRVCNLEALKFCGGDQNAASHLLFGHVLISSIPPELRAKNADANRRAEWIKGEAQELAKKKKAFFSEIQIDFDEE